MRFSSRRPVQALFALAAAAALAGCGGVSVEKPTPAASTAAAGDGKAAAPAREVSVKEARAEEMIAAVDTLKGSVVLVDFWATWCGPCVKKFPHLVEMQKKYADQGLVCISISLDKLGSDDYKQEKVLAFLREKEARFTNFVAAEPQADDKKIGARFGDFDVIPHMALFDRTGKRVWDSGSSPFPPKEFSEKLEQLVIETLRKKN